MIGSLAVFVLGGFGLSVRAGWCVVSSHFDEEDRAVSKPRDVCPGCGRPYDVGEEIPKIGGRCLPSRPPTPFRGEVSPRSLETRRRQAGQFDDGLRKAGSGEG